MYSMYSMYSITVCTACTVCRVLQYVQYVQYYCMCSMYSMYSVYSIQCVRYVQYVQYVQCVRHVRYVRYVRYVQYVQYVQCVRYVRYVQYVQYYSMYSMYSMYSITVCTVCTVLQCVQYVQYVQYYSVYSMYSMYSMNVRIAHCDAGICLVQGQDLEHIRTFLFPAQTLYYVIFLKDTKNYHSAHLGHFRRLPPASEIHDGNLLRGGGGECKNHKWQRFPDNRIMSAYLSRDRTIKRRAWGVRWLKKNLTSLELREVTRDRLIRFYCIGLDMLFGVLTDILMYTPCISGNTNNIVKQLLSQSTEG